MPELSSGSDLSLGSSVIKKTFIGLQPEPGCATGHFALGVYKLHLQYLGLSLARLSEGEETRLRGSLLRPHSQHELSGQHCPSILFSVTLSPKERVLRSWGGQGS